MSGKHPCKGKRRFLDEIAAMMALTKIGEYGMDRGKKPTRAYSCRLCDGWHLTSQPKRERV